MWTQIRYKVIFCIVLIVICFGAGMMAQKYWFAPPVITQYMSQNDAQKPESIQNAADASKTNISPEQRDSIAHDIERASGAKPDEQILTTGANLQSTLDNLHQNTNSDFQIVTDPQKPNQKPNIIPNQPYDLNVYNIKAYPSQLITIQYDAGSYSIGNSWRVNVPKIPLLLSKGATGYIGIYDRFDHVQHKNFVGVSITIPRK